jgi:hypothetical protein
MTPLVGFGALLLAGTALIACLGGHDVELALEGAAGAASVLVGLWLGRRRRHPFKPWAVESAHRGDSTARGPQATRSGATVLLAIGVGTMAFGAEVGQWLLLIGAGVAVAGIGGLVAERRRA